MIFLFAKPILLIFGDEFVMGVPVLVIVGCGMLINAATRICHSMVSMTGHSKLVFFNSTAGLILNVILNVILIPRRGIIGAAIATLLALTTIGLLRLIQVYWFMRIWPYSLTLVKPLFATAVSLLVGLILNRFLPAEHNLVYFILDAFILGLSYIIVIVLLGLSEEDYTVLSRAGRRLYSVISR